MFYNLSLDDLIPRFTDFGLLNRLLNAVPDIKITAFVPANSLTWGAGRNDILKHLGWCERVAALPAENFECALHGYYHDDFNKQPEFANLSVIEAKERLLLAEEALAQAAIPHVRGFRPPRWVMSAGTAQALGDLDYLFLADCVGLYTSHRDVPMTRIFTNADIHTGLWSSVPEWKELVPDPSKIYLDRGHFVGRGVNNLGANIGRVISTIRSLKEPRFVFLSELAMLSNAEKRELGLFRWKGNLN